MRLRPSTWPLSAAGVVACILMVSCSRGSSQDSLRTSCPESSVAGGIVVFAASSMSNVLNSVKDEFEQQHPCVTSLTFSYGSSATLATQLVNGSPADVFLSASSSTMDTVTQEKLNVGDPFVFARNKGEIMISSQSKNQSKISEITDLFSLQPQLQVGVCVPSAPCGGMADKILEKARVLYGRSDLSRKNVDVEASSVEDLVSKITMGELDAGIVYHSDCVWAQKNEKVTCVDIPNTMNDKTLNVSTSYLVVSLSKKTGAQEFVSYVSSPEFQNRLQTTYGFLAP